MSHNKILIHEGEILETTHISLNELCRHCEIHAERVISLIEEGIIQPSGVQPSDWLFNGADVVRVQVVLRLQRDLEINTPGAALALQLLDEIASLQKQLKRFE